MPTTVNGIGTHYYGKRDVSVRTAICGSCRRPGNLTSYETRLWFVVLFIPVIPLGRKRILDQCPSCSRHRVANADAFEQARQLQTSASLERFRREPSPEAALEAHAYLLGFHEHEQAAAFRRTALERYPEHAELRTGLASQLDQILAFDESAGLYKNALDLEPDLPAARAGVARRKMAEGELDEARRLLDFLEVPGASHHHDLGPLDVLSNYYQQAGRHEDALTMAGHLLREFPQAGQHHAFRTFVRKSEKALRRPESILPPREHSLRGLFRAEGSPYSSGQRKFVLAALGLGLLAAGLLVNNEYIRRNRSLYVVNACGQPVQIRVDGGPPQAVSGLGRLTLSEGRHRLQVGGPVEETHDIALHSGFFERWSGSPLWVLNPGGEAVLEEITVYYAKAPRPSQHRLIAGKPFVAFPHVDYPFLPPPDKVSVSKKRNAEIVKTVVEWLQTGDAVAFMATAATDRDAAATFAERRLRRNPDTKDLLTYYVGSATPAEFPRVEAFLKSKLDRHPVQIPWHRAYQYVAERNGHTDQLIPLYDGLLASRPDDAALLYLRGRIEPDYDRQESFFRRSMAADPRFPWSWFARGVGKAAGARWDESLRDLEKARNLRIDPDQVAGPIHTVRLAKGEAKALVGEYQARLAAAPTDLDAMVFLADALAASGQSDRIVPEFTAWVNRLQLPIGSDATTSLRALALYQAGKLEECVQICDRFGPLKGGSIPAQALLALGRVKEVADDASFQEVWDDPWNILAVSLAFSLDGRGDESAAWLERACRGLEERAHGAQRAAKALRASEPMTADELARVVVDADEKALMYAVLGARFPAKRDEYHAAARRFNLRYKPPHQLVRRAAGDAGTP